MQLTHKVRLWEAHSFHISRAMLTCAAPDFTQPDTAGQVVKLSDFRDKYLLVNFC